MTSGSMPGFLPWKSENFDILGTSGPHNFQMDSIILQNSKFWSPVDHVKNP